MLGFLWNPCNMLRPPPECPSTVENSISSYNYCINFGFSLYGAMRDGYTKPIDVPTFLLMFVH